MTDIVAAVGEESLLEGFPLAGVALHVAETEEQAREAWAALPAEAAVVILTAHAAAALERELRDPEVRMTVVLPT